MVAGRRDVEDAGGNQLAALDELTDIADKFRDAGETRQAAFVEADAAFVALIGEQFTAGALKQEQGDETLPGVFAVGDVEYF